MSEDLYWIWISRIEYLDYETLIKLLEDYKSLDKVWNLKRTEIESKDYLSVYVKKRLLDFNLRKNLNRYLEYIKRNNIKIINFKDELYPERLKYIENRPIVIYVMGNIEGINKESVRYCWCKKMY